MVTTSKWLAIVAVTFVAGSFIASPELRAFAANTVGSADIINETILSEDIKNSQVKASDIATDAVGAAEIQGVTKLLFGRCVLTSDEAGRDVISGSHLAVQCGISGVASGDTAIATLNLTLSCFQVSQAFASTGSVQVQLKNECPTAAKVGPATIGVMVFDK